MTVLDLPVTKTMSEHLKDRLHRVIRASDNERVLEKISGPLQSALEIVENKALPRTIYKQLPLISSDEKSVMTHAGPIESPMFSSLVNRSSKNRQVVFMAATLGPVLENSVNIGHDILSQWVYDLVGSELIELVADEVEHRLTEDLAKQGLQTTRRFSPGYCDWSIEGQDIIFKAFDADSIDIRLTSHKMMMPKKSISGVLGCAEKVPVKIPCLLCSKNNCPHRRRQDD